MGSPYFARWAQYGLWLRLCAHCVARIRLRNRPISLSLHTGSLSPYFARWAQYGLWLRLCAHCVARIRLRNRPISPVGLNTGSCHPGVALRLPRAVFWRPFRALISPRPTCHICRRQIFIPPRQICHICRRQIFIPPRYLWRGGGRQAGGEVRCDHPDQKIRVLLTHNC